MVRIFHSLIVAYFLLLASGCGYKANPYYANPDEAINFDDLSNFNGQTILEE